ncbi:DUF1236 domain-containing protein [Rhizobium mayense]|uniref:DUF1236 domain-containing protein n=1 Tax=Rhizobium mayense TaxID=1312184 RepID=A0ABT7JP06_9HYPH|nr:DUF1236 domain-containing protein [Rhizobium mayense]MDL2398082.1 DUF1236 domain-containing protein [Rhizobium mayense]
MTRNLFYILLASAALSLSPVAHSVATAQNSQDSTILPKASTPKGGSGETQKPQGGIMEKSPGANSTTKQGSGEPGSSDTQPTGKTPSSDTTQKSGTSTDTQKSNSEDTQQTTTPGKTQTDQSKSSTGNNGTSGTAKTGSSNSQTDTTQENTGKSSTTNIAVEQQTQVRQVIKQVHTQPVQQTEIKTVSVGSDIPRSIRLEVLPSRIVKIVPEYKSYRFFVLDDGRIVIVDPNTFRIIFILEA